MKIFIDSANIEEVRQAAEMGIISGVTTNPSLVAREGRDFRQVVMEICGLVDGPVSAEVGLCIIFKEFFIFGILFNSFY